jgi:threonine dehydrogenase-like Zn-dependent dehydrogenase
MKVAVTAAPRHVLLEERPDPGAPAPGQTVVRVEMVGICGSDLHLYRDELGDSHAGLLPRIMGHEFSAVVEQADPAGSAFEPGDRVAMWPMLPCGRCHTCLDGRPNVCADLRIIGVHDDGALQEHYLVPTSNLVATPDLSARQASLIEPVAVSVHAINRGRVGPGEHVVVLGAGPIGAAAALAAADRGADVLVLDPVTTRRDLLRSWGFAAEWTDEDALSARIAEHGSTDGPHVVIDTTGRATVLDTAITAVRHGGRIVVVGLTGEQAPIHPGVLPLKELDVLGTSCCRLDEFVAAADLVRRHAATVETLISHHLPLPRASDAFRQLDEHPEETVKILIDVGGDP